MSCKPDPSKAIRGSEALLYLEADSGDAAARELVQTVIVIGAYRLLSDHYVLYSWVFLHMIENTRHGIRGDGDELHLVRQFGEAWMHATGLTSRTSDHRIYDQLQQERIEKRPVRWSGTALAHRHQRVVAKRCRVNGMTLWWITLSHSTERTSPPKGYLQPLWCGRPIEQPLAYSLRNSDTTAVPPMMRRTTGLPSSLRYWPSLAYPQRASNLHLFEISK